MEQQTPEKIASNELNCKHCGGNHRSYEHKGNVDIEKIKRDNMEELKIGKINQENKGEEKESINPDEYREQLLKGNPEEIEKRKKELYEGTHLGK